MKRAIFFGVIVFCCNFTVAYEIAITFDDLPAQGTDIAGEQLEINSKILNALKAHHFSAIGFVNEGKLYRTNESQQKVAILKLWLDNGNRLGNHTFSHNNLSRTNLEEYKNDVIRGESVIKKLMNARGMQLVYFRHPYLDTGNSPELRRVFEEFLKKRNYVIAPVTIDTDDWKFNRQLINNPSQQELIIAKYLKHTRDKFSFYEMASKKIFGRNIKHIWLLHVNLINSLAIENLLQIVKDYNYKGITLEQALSDKVYKEPVHYYDSFGVSWLYRWDFTRKIVVDWSREPEPALES